MNSLPVRVLVVDNDAAMRHALRSSLAANGYAVEEARTGEEAIQAAGERQFSLVLLDVEMPGMGGIEACRRLRSMVPSAGIVMITVCDREEDKIQALEAGADDYVTKPFSVRELLARLRAVTRRVTIQLPVTTVRIGNLELDTHHRTLRKSGVVVRLSPIEFALLSYLMQHANVPIQHVKLLRTIWGPEYGSEFEYLRTYVKRLRKKIEPDALHPEYLRTVPWLGYQFCEPAEFSASFADRDMRRAASA